MATSCLVACSAILGLDDPSVVTSSPADADSASDSGFAAPDANGDGASPPADSGVCRFTAAAVNGTDYAGWKIPNGTSSTTAASYTTALGVVTDTITGLQWMKTPAKTGMNFDQAKSYCQNAPGVWRLPGRLELATLQSWNGGAGGLCEDTTTFDKFSDPEGVFWTSTPNANALDQAWAVHFGQCGLLPSPKTNPDPAVRCVRGEVAVPSFEVSDACGVVRDLKSGIEWQRRLTAPKVEGFPAVKSSDAKSHCAALRHGAPGPDNGWFLPTAQELYAIVDSTKSGPAIDTQLFPDAPKTARLITSTVAGTNTKSAMNTEDGQYTEIQETETASVICMRYF